MLSDFGTYKRYLALKRHFASDYDFIKYNGSVTAKEGTFLKRNDKWQFLKLSKKYSDDEMTKFMVANFIAEDVKWVGDLLTTVADQRYKDFISRQQSMSYHFKQDMDVLLEDIPFNRIFQRTDTYPPLLTAYIENDISIETLIILNRLTPFFSDFDEMYGKDDFVWGRVRTKCEKLAPFLNYDLNACKKALRSLLQDA